MNDTTKQTDAAGYYQAFLKNPLLAPLAKLPTGAQLKTELGHLPPKPDASVRAFPADERMTCLSKLRQIHIPLGRDVQLASLIFDLIRDGYLARTPSPASVQRQHEQASQFAKAITSRVEYEADYESVGGALIGMSGTGKTRTLKRVLQLIPQVVELDVRKYPYLRPKMLTYVRVECPSNLTHTGLITSIFSAIENALGAKLPERLKTGNISTQAENMAQVCLELYLGVLIVDEIQHVLQRDGAPEPKLMNFLVELSNKLGVPIVLVGTPRAQQVVGGEMRQARRMLGPEWSNLKKDSKPWNDLMSELWQYQFTREVIPFEKVADDFYALTQGVPALAVTLFRIAQRYAIAMETPDSNSPITSGLLKAVYDDYFKPVAPMVNALASGDPNRISLYEDLKFDGQQVEDQMLADLANYREKCRIKLLASTTRSYRKAKKVIRTGVLKEAAALSEAAPSNGSTRTLMDAYEEAMANGKNPATAVEASAP